MSEIVGLVILPPIAIARLGTSAHPVDAYDLVVDTTDPLGYRRIVPRPTFHVDPVSGEVDGTYTPKEIYFRDNMGIRPVAPFFEVHARMKNGDVQPLTLAMMKAAGWSPSDVVWTVRVANLKAFRRTRIDADKVLAEVTTNDHEIHPLSGKADNFLAGESIPLGQVRYLKPSNHTPESCHIRLRFVPATGKVYGTSPDRIDASSKPVKDLLFPNGDRVVYDERKGSWRGFIDKQDDPTKTDPSDVYHGISQPLQAQDDNKISLGYLDDVCDGRITVAIGEFTASALVSVGMPAFAPDSLPIRSVADEIEQALFGPAVKDEDTCVDDAIEIVRRALDTVRHMNTVVMNGNTIDGRVDVAPTLGTQDSNDFGRFYEPIIAPSLVDNLAVRVLHARILGALQSGSAPWFSRVLRRPEDVGDLSDAGRRKMPPMLRGSDGFALTLTRRQIDKIAQGNDGDIVKARNRSARVDRALINQLTRPTAGNPISALPVSAISNCYPGLEFDFRNFWRRTFEGIVLLEWDNLVVESDLVGVDLKHHRLLRVAGRSIVVPVTGPIAPDAEPVRLGLEGDTEIGMTLELSNALAFAVSMQGQWVSCEFTKDESPDPAPPPDDKTKTLEVRLKVRKFFEPNTATPSADLLEPGELTQSLCSPWQHDYRECACYYWPATRPDFVNVEADADGVSRGDNWLARDRVGRYVLDDRKDDRVITYEELFERWEKMLHFVIAGRDSKES